MPLSPDLLAAVEAFAARPTLLVASDFDGALAPLVPDPRDSRPVEGGMETLAELAALPGVEVALVSGRSLRDLAELSGAPADFVLIGSHGTEDSRHPEGLALTEDQQGMLAVLDEELADLVEEHPGVWVEEKPAGRVVHTRRMDPVAGPAALDAAAALGARHTSLVSTPGKEVVELAVAHVGKGAALVDLADELAVDAVFYAGDDVTDEHAFAALAANDDEARSARRLTVRVGEGETAAQFRVEDEPHLVELFRTLTAARRAATQG
ncbi:trehalose-phosphatase [Ornithinimicrobium sp. Y1847]|uniref:trehalose-phosphatase n=1 Tax=unclassified Ornithinimicrobium TaxID=2615080 RepID=UPI003B68291A